MLQALFHPFLGEEFPFAQIFAPKTTPRIKHEKVPMQTSTPKRKAKATDTENHRRISKKKQLLSAVQMISTSRTIKQPTNHKRSRVNVDIKVESQISSLNA